MESLRFIGLNVSGVHEYLLKIFRGGGVIGGDSGSYLRR